MKYYTITKKEYDETAEKNSWSNIFEYIEKKQTYKKEIELSEFISLEKEFLQTIRNFVDIFELQSLYYNENTINLNYEYEKNSFEENIIWEETHDKDDDYIKYRKYQLTILEIAKPLAKQHMKEVIRKACQKTFYTSKEKVFIQSKEEALCSMHLTLRNLYNTEIFDTQTGATISTGNSGLYLYGALPDDIDIEVLLKNTSKLKYELQVAE